MVDTKHCEYCGWKKGKFRKALRLIVCIECLRWLKTKMPRARHNEW
jgi:hypothetical protein